MKFQGLRDFLFAAGGRKYTMTLGAGAVNTALFASAVLSESGYITLTLATVGAYLAADGVQTWRHGKDGAPKSSE